jgi:hypothetical protein
MSDTKSLSNNVILTGVPRGGTTLAAALLDSLDDTVCLSEPDSHHAAIIASASSGEYIHFLISNFEETRTKLLAGGPVLNRREEDDSPTTNYFTRDEATGRMISRIVLKEVCRHDLTPGFMLAMKHNAHYTSVLDEIVRCGYFTAVAILRNPVDTILSWRSLELPVSRGRLPAAEIFWMEMRDLTRADMNLTEKHVRIFDLLCKRYAELRDSLIIIKYEDFAEDPELIPSVLGRNPRFRGTFPVKKVKKYDTDPPAELMEAIIRYGHYFREFYPEILR